MTKPLPTVEDLRVFVELPDDSATHIENLENALRRAHELLAMPPEEVERDAERWKFLPLVHPMDICTVAMGAPTPQEFRRGMERAVDKLIDMAKQREPQKG